MDTFGPLALGLLAAMVLFTMVLRWVSTIATVIKKHWTYGGSPKRQRTLLWALPVVLVLHSGPWAIFAIVLIAFNTLAVTHAGAWNWLFAGLFFGLALQVCFALLVLLKVRKLRAARSANARTV